MSHVIISGGTTPGGGTPNRLEINTLIQDQVQFSLYIQALNAIFAKPSSDPLSHFSIGGIHGLPYVQWDGVGGTSPVSGTEWDGYCTHGSYLFPTWHRPYVALYEQSLQQQALEIAQTYGDRQRWVAAAQTLRAPYWDWATNSVPPPQVIQQTTITILAAPDGSPTDVPNPLYQYTFDPTDISSFPAPWNSWLTTIRGPDDPDSLDAATDVQLLISDLQQSQEDITSKTYNLMSRVYTWPAFSNHTAGDGGSSSNSLEGIHDDIHGLVSGQMGHPQVAGLDPLFFLHHCNVDRLLSLWSAINPGVWVKSGPAERGTWTIPVNSTIDANTPLTPFRNTQTGYWASSGVMTTTVLGYTYPEFNGLDLGNQSAVQQAIIQYVNNQYGPGGVRTTSSSARPGISLFAQPPAAGGAQAPVASGTSLADEAVSVVKSASASAGILHPFHSRGGPPHTVEKAQHGKEGQAVIHDWACRIHCKKYELGGSFWILVFLGQVPDDPSQWRPSPSFVGGHYVFANSSAGQCANCRGQADVVSEGFVHLNKAIASRSGLSSFEPSVVSPYLKENLHWRVQAANRSAVDLSRLPSLEVTVSSTPLTYTPGGGFPEAGEPQYHHHITHGRQGGARHAQV